MCLSLHVYLSYIEVILLTVQFERCRFWHRQLSRPGYMVQFAMNQKQ
jgi:hypothetical protein